MNVRAKKQLTYTKLPGKDLSTEITANVTDFEMDPITINGMKLRLDIKVDDQEIMKNANQLSDSIGTITSSIGKLNKASDSLLTGANQMLEQTLSSVTAQINSVLGKTVNLTANNYHSILQSLRNQASSFPSSKRTAMQKRIRQWETAIEGIEQFVTSLKQYTSGVSTAYHSSVTLNNGLQTLQHGTATLQKGTEKLAKGTSKLHNKTKELPNTISDTINRVTASVQTKDSTVTSFTSNKNTNVSSVQFAIKTEKIKAPEAEVVVEKAVEKKGFFEKLKALF